MMCPRGTTKRGVTWPVTHRSIAESVFGRPLATRMLAGLLDLCHRHFGVCTTASASADTGNHQVSFAQALKSYKYEAPALSLLERLGLDRFWGTMVSHVYPAWLAPNVLTAGGGLCVGLAAALTLWHSPSLDGSAPCWVYAVNALLIFCYQTLDGSDGKQARRTQSGSPVGELMDHGIDAWAVGAMVTTCLDAFGFGLGSPWPWMILLGAQSAFFASNLTLLHAGRMRVDDVGVIELQGTMIACLLVTAAMSPAVWRTVLPAPIGLELRVALGRATVVAMVIAVASGVGEALAVSRRQWRAESGGGAVPSRRGSVVRQTGLMATYAAAIAVALTQLGVVNATRAAGDTATHRLLLLQLLLLGTNGAFAELMARTLMLRIGNVPLPRVGPPGLLALFAFVLARAVDARAVAAPAACALAAAVLHVGYFASAVRASAAALGLHPFRVRGARSWKRL